MSLHTTPVVPQQLLNEASPDVSLGLIGANTFLDRSLPDTLVSAERMEHVILATPMLESIRERQAMVLEKQILDLAMRSRGHLAIDHIRVSDFTCAWINALISLTERSQKLGGRLAIFGLTLAGEEMLRETGLHRKLHIARSRASALEMIGVEQPTLLQRALLSLLSPSARRVA